MILWMKKNVHMRMLDNGIVVPLGKLGFKNIRIAQINGEFVVAVLDDVSGIGVSVSGSPFIRRILADDTFYEENKKLFVSAKDFFEEYDKRKDSLEKSPVCA